MSTKRYWVEVTKQDHGHGGNGWDYRKWLWSPTEDIQGKKIYEPMNFPDVGDIVVHIYEINGIKYIDGESEIASKVSKVPTQPPSPGPWSGRSEYYKIQLKNFKQFYPRKEVQNFIKANAALIAAEKMSIPKYFTFDKNLRLNQGLYLSEITQNIYNAI